MGRHGVISFGEVRVYALWPHEIWTLSAVAGLGKRTSENGCLGRTRKDVLWEIERWLTGEQEQNVFWLNGLAGTGKSTIAQTVAGTAFAGGKLGAGFFCSRDFANWSNIQAIFPALAFQLAHQHPDFRKELLQVLRARPDAAQGSLCSQQGARSLPSHHRHAAAQAAPDFNSRCLL